MNGIRKWAVVRDRWFVIPALAACLVFAVIVTQGSGRFWVHEALGSFYDAQATSLLHGRLDVPAESIQWEGFIHDGKWYGYFGPTPALLRLPFAMLGIGAGRLTRSFLLADFVAALLASYLMLRDATEHGSGRKSPRPRWSVLLVANVGAGSTLLFLGGRAYVYHEAILCGVAFALWSVWATLRYLRTAEKKWWLTALGCGVFSIQARAPTGLFALTCLGLAAGWRGYRRWRGNAAIGECGWIALAAIVGVLSFNAVSYLKFGTFEGCPLRMNLQYTPERLAAIDGREFHLGNIGYGAAAYLGPHARLVPYFPYVEMTAPDPVTYPGAKMDVTDGVLGVPFAMAGLTLAALVGLAAACRRPAAAEAAPAAVSSLAVIPLAGALFAAVAVAHRYTADFCPFLITAAVLGFAALDRLNMIGRILFPPLLGATLVAVPLTIILTVDFQGARVWGVPNDVRSRYAGFRRAIDRMLGTVDPHGYDVQRLPVRMVDQGIIRSVITTMTADPEKASQAIATGRVLAEDFPEEPGPRLQLALLLCNANRISEGTAEFQALARRFPDFAPGHYFMAVLHARENRLADAERELETAVRLDPGNPDYRNALAALQTARLFPRPRAEKEAH